MLKLKIFFPLIEKSYNFNNFFAESCSWYQNWWYHERLPLRLKSACLRLPRKHSPVLISAADADPSPDSVHNRVTRAPNKFARKSRVCRRWQSCNTRALFLGSRRDGVVHRSRLAWSRSQSSDATCERVLPVERIVLCSSRSRDRLRKTRTCRCF